jgi:hypothetical protein
MEGGKYALAPHPIEHLHPALLTDQHPRVRHHGQVPREVGLACADTLRNLTYASLAALQAFGHGQSEWVRECFHDLGLLRIPTSQEPADLVSSRAKHHLRYIHKTLSPQGVAVWQSRQC